MQAGHFRLKTQRVMVVECLYPLSISLGLANTKRWLVLFGQAMPPTWGSTSVVVTNVAVNVGLWTDALVRFSMKIFVLRIENCAERNCSSPVCYLSCFLLIGVQFCGQFESTLVCTVCPLDKNK